MTSFLESTLLVVGVAFLYPLLLLCSYLFSRLVTTRPSPLSSAAEDIDTPLDTTASPASYGTLNDPSASEPISRTVDVAMGHSPHSLSSSSSRRSLQVSRCVTLCRALPRPPPVLLMLLTGIAMRAVLETEQPSVRFLFGASLAAHPSRKGADNTMRAEKDAARRQVRFLTWLLASSRPFMLLALATIAQNIGSHLSYARLTRLHRPLTLFLCGFFTIVYVVMFLLYTGSADPLFGLDGRQSALEDGVAAIVASSTEGQQSDATTAVAVRHAAEALLSFHRVYLRRTTWTFALVAAAVTLERSSPEFLSAMQSTGVTSGLIPLFTLCVAACQDVFALIAFIVFSAMASSRQTDATLTLSEKVGDLRAALAAHTTASSVSSSPSSPTTITELIATEPRTQAGLDAVIANRRSTGLQLVLIANATLGALLTALLVRRLCFFSVSDANGPGAWLRRVSWAAASSPHSSHADVDVKVSAGNRSDEDVGQRPVSGSPLLFARSGTNASPPPADAFTRSTTTYVLLIAVSLTLVLWEMATPCELLLAAVFSGAAINFYTPCPYFEAGMKATQTLCNVVLFTTMGLRTSFSSHPRRSLGTRRSAGHRSEATDALEASIASAPLVRQWQSAIKGPSARTLLQWGVLFFTVRVFACWLGGLVGGFIAMRLSPLRHAAVDGGGGTSQTQAATTVAMTPGSETRVPRLDAVAESDDEEDDRIAEAAAARAAGTHWYIGFALLTQLAIALTLNERGSEEYDARLRDILPTQDILFVEPVAKASAASSFTATDNKDGRTDRQFTFALDDVLLPMRPLTQAYTVAIVCAMLVGPVLGAWFLRKVGPMTKYRRAHHE